MDKIDGPYYFFPLLKRMRDTLPGWVPLVGVDLGDTNVVPVDYVAKAMDHIAHQPDLDGQAFHLVNPEPLSTVGLINSFAVGREGAAVRRTRRPAASPPAAHRAAPPGRCARPTLVGAALRLPPVHLALEPDDRPARRPAGGARARRRSRRSTPPGPPRRRSPAPASRCPTSSPTPRRCGRTGRRCSTTRSRATPSVVKALTGKTVVITGASSGIGLVTAVQVAKAGAIPILVARGPGEARGDQAADREPGRHGVRLSLRPLRPARHRRADQAALRGLRPHRLRGQQRRPLDPALAEAERGPLPRLRAHHAAELLRRDPAGDGPAAEDARAEVRATS